MLWGITLIEWLTVFALLAGPVSAVWVTRFIDKKREHEKRKWEIFRNLICFRGNQLSKAFVESFSLVEVEFYDDKEVLEVWKELYEHLFTQEPPDDSLKQQFYEEREKATLALYKKMASSLDIKLNSLDVSKHGYFPQGWVDQQDKETLLQNLLGQVLSGSRPFPITIINFPEQQNDINSENT